MAEDEKKHGKKEAANVEETTAKEVKKQAKGKSSKQSKDKPEKIKKVKAEIVKKPKKGGVGGNGNLVPFDQRTEDEQREIRSKGGKARAAKLRKQKDLREFTRNFLFQRAVPALQNNMNILGVDQEEQSNLAAMVVRLFSKAVNAGDLNAARTIIEWAGMAPLQQERENEAIAKMSQVMELAAGETVNKEDESFVFYIPQNGRPVLQDDQ